MKLQESGENYLETILILKNKNGYVRSIDIANELGYSKPSISRAVSILKEAGYIIVESTGNIKLTEEGYMVASKVYERHIIISRYLVDALGVSTETADSDACRIEHIISDETFSKMKDYIISRRHKV